MSTQYEELQHLADNEPTYSGSPDMAAIRGRGRTLRTRRRIVAGAGAGLAALTCAGVVAATGALTPTSANLEPTPVMPAASTSTSSDPSASDPSDVLEREPRTEGSLRSLEEVRTGVREPAVCGVIACDTSASKEPSGREPETATPLGEVMPLGPWRGDTEVLYAVRVHGTDLRTGERARVVALMAGLESGGQLLRTVHALQPGTEERRGDIGVYGGRRVSDVAGGGTHYGVVGFVRGEHESVQVRGTDGTTDTRTVTGSSTAVLPGWTVFYDTGEWQESWDGSAEVTYSVPGGPECTLGQGCGAIE